MTQVNPKGKVVFVSGANRGIGKSITIELLERGAAKVYAGSRNIDTLSDLKAKYGERLVPVVLDLSNDTSISQASKVAADVDILINNAGVLVGGEVLTKSAIKGLQDNFEVNVFGTLKLTLAFKEQLKKSSETAIVNLSSLAGLANMPVIGTYSVSKAAVHSITQGLRGELVNDNVLVSCAYPGPIDTDMVRGMEMPKDSPENVTKSIVDGLENGTEYIFPDQMSAEAGPVYLASPQGIETQFGSFVAS